jgi:hypothetical protein
MVEIAKPEKQKQAGTAIAKAFKLLMKKIKEKKKKARNETKKGRGKLLNK